MGARNLNRVQFTLERDVVRIFGRCTGGDTSNPTGVKGKGVTSIARTANTLTITLADKWNGLLMFNANVIDSGTPDDWEFVLSAETVASTKTLVVKVFKGGTAADLPTTAVLLFEVVVCNNAQKPVSY